MKRLLLILTVLSLSACGGPLAIIPGGALSGPEMAFSLKHIPAEDIVIQLETRPRDPYSVNVNAMVVEGGLFIDPASDRNWYPHLIENNNVRIKLPGEDTVFTAQAEAVTDPTLLRHFDTSRNIFRLLPR